MPDFCASKFGDEEAEDASPFPEHLNRCATVTDERKSASQNRTIRCKGGPLKSACRELPGVALAASAGPVYRLRMNRGVQAYQLWRKRIQT